MELGRALVNFFKKAVGVLLIFLSTLFFGASFIGLSTGEYGPLILGLIISLFLFAGGLMLLTNMERTRERILCIFQAYFPRCPICKTMDGYQVKGLIPTSQYVRCKHCSAEWASPDFVNARNLTELKLWNPPLDTQAYRDFMTSGYKLQLRKAYPTNIWQAYMDGRVEQPETKPSLSTFQMTSISPNKRGLKLAIFSILLMIVYPFLSAANAVIGAFLLSVGASLLLSTIGFYGFTVSKENSYILFCGALITVLFGLLGLPAFLGR